MLLLTALSAVALTTACIKENRPILASVNDSVIVTGVTTDANGLPLGGTNITAEQDESVLGVSDEAGAFRVAIPRAKVRSITANLSFERKTFFLYFDHQASGQMAISSPISIDDIGDKPLNSVILAEAAGVTGKALKADAGQIVAPASGSTVRIGAQSAIVGTDGRFTFSRVPAGRVPVTVTTAGARPYYEEIQLIAGQTLSLPDPMIVFVGPGPQGVLIEKPGQYTLEQLVKSGHPTLKHFRIFAAENTRYVRIHHDLAKLEALEQQERTAATTDLAKKFSLTQSTAKAAAGAASASTQSVTGASPGVSSADIPWHTITTDIDYDFPADGGQVLYYQFADFTKTKLSRFYQVGVDVDVFADSDGFTGASQDPWTSSRIQLDIDLPIAAVSMRFAEEIKDLEATPWLPAAATHLWDFHPKETDAKSGGEPILRKLYGQFRDAYGHDSGVFDASFELRLFPNFTLTVGDGSGLVTTRVVDVTLGLPPEAIFMRSAEASEDLKDGVWLGAAEATRFSFKPIEDTISNEMGISGNRQVCYQLKDNNGFVSQALCEHVSVDLFGPAPTYGFVINGGATVSTSRLVELTITAPPSAMQMRIYENAPDSETTITNSDSESIYTTGGSVSIVARTEWLPVTATSFFTFYSAGTKNLVMQFRTADGLVSSSYAQPIVILPMEESYRATDFVINGGSNFAVSPYLVIDIANIPSTAVAMALIVRDSSGLIALNSGLSVDAEDFSDSVIWEPLSNQVVLPVRDQGTKAVSLIFRNSDGELSPVIKRLIDYDAFPADLVAVTFAAGASTMSRNVVVNIDAPDTAYAMRYALDANVLDSQPYQPFASAFDFELPVTTGNYRLYVQLKAANEDESLIFSTPIINYNPLPLSALSVVMAGGATNATSPTVSVAITAPSTATEMRLGTSMTSLNAAAWQTFESSIAAYNLPNADGTYALYVQVRTADGNTSEAFKSQDLTLDVP